MPATDERPLIETASSLRSSLSITARVSGSTYGFYKYPASFHPNIAREAIATFTRRGEWILDPFMGGGTTVVEALSAGRKAVGCDINALARFVTEVRTRPLSRSDRQRVQVWAETVARFDASQEVCPPLQGIVNLPKEIESFIGRGISLASPMSRRRRRFARAILLRLGQLVIDCRQSEPPIREELSERLLRISDAMLDGMDQFVANCQAIGVQKRNIAGRRILLHRNAVGIEAEFGGRKLEERPRLVITSPPYPGVHILYHRWQYQGRRETPAPYWIADVEDGLGASYYCGGSRTPTGLRNYREMIVHAFTSIRESMHSDGHVVQVIGFADAVSQLPMYLDCLERAGLRDVSTEVVGHGTLRRDVVNRKWYAHMRGAIDSSKEYLLIHRLR